MFESTSRRSALAKHQMQMLLISSPPHETIRSEVQFMADNGNILALKELVDEDQMRFLEIIDQVCVRYLPYFRMVNFGDRDAGYTKHR